MSKYGGQCFARSPPWDGTVPSLQWICATFIQTRTPLSALDALDVPAESREMIANAPLDSRAAQLLTADQAIVWPPAWPFAGAVRYMQQALRLFFNDRPRKDVWVHGEGLARALDGIASTATRLDIIAKSKPDITGFWVFLLRTLALYFTNTERRPVTIGPARAGSAVIVTVDRDSLPMLQIFVHLCVRDWYDERGRDAIWTDRIAYGLHDGKFDDRRWSTSHQCIAYDCVIPSHVAALAHHRVCPRLTLGGGVVVRAAERRKSGYPIRDPAHIILSDADLCNCAFLACCERKFASTVASGRCWMCGALSIDKRTCSRYSNFVWCTPCSDGSPGAPVAGVIDRIFSFSAPAGSAMGRRERRLLANNMLAAVPNISITDTPEPVVCDRCLGDECD